MVLISVVIPFYSSLPGLLKNAVISALNQSVKSIEVIVVDDDSPLSAINELKEINDTRLKILKHSVNSNGGIARNTGIDNANGKFIAFLDYDDIWYEHKLKLQLELYNLHCLQSQDDVVVYSRSKIVDGKRTMIRPLRSIAEEESVGEYLFCAKQIIQTSGIFLETKLAKEVRFDDLKRHQDYQFCLSLESVGAKFIMLDKPSYEFIQIPKLNDYDFALFWLNKYSKYLNKPAVKGFKNLVVLRSIISHGKYFHAFKYAKNERMLLSFFKSIFFKIIKETIVIFSTNNK
ncbi:glycosyltransferase family 2 protein [Vibrio cyclitrophicus]